MLEKLGMRSCWPIGTRHASYAYVCFDQLEPSTNRPYELKKFTERSFFDTVPVGWCFFCVYGVYRVRSKQGLRQGEIAELPVENWEIAFADWRLTSVSMPNIRSLQDSSLCTPNVSLNKLYRYSYQNYELNNRIRSIIVMYFFIFHDTSHLFFFYKDFVISANLMIMTLSLKLI